MPWAWRDGAVGLAMWRGERARNGLRKVPGGCVSVRCSAAQRQGTSELGIRNPAPAPARSQLAHALISPSSACVMRIDVRITARAPKPKTKVWPQQGS